MPNFCAKCGRNRMEHFLRDALAHIETLNGENERLRLGNEGALAQWETAEAQLADRNTLVEQHVEAYKSAHDRAQVADAEVARLTEERDTLSHLYTLSETAKNLAYTERGKADTALATLRGKVISLNYLVRDIAEATSTGEFFKGAQWVAEKIARKVDALGLPDTEAK